MSLIRMPRISPLLLLFAIMFPATVQAQLGLRNARGANDEYSRRASQFMTNRGLSDMYLRRLHGQSLLFGRSNSHMGALHTRPLIMNSQFGLLRSFQGPTDRAGRWLRGYRLFEIDSEIARSAVDLPQLTDNNDISQYAWSTEEVLSAMRRDRSTATLALAEPAESLGPASGLENQLRLKSDAYFEKCAASFQESLETRDGRKRSLLIAESRNCAELVIQIEIDQPRGYLAAAIVAFHTNEFNTALINLELGLKRGDTLDSLYLDPKSFFAGGDKWRRLIDQVNGMAGQLESNPKISLFQSYVAFLNGDIRSAHTSANKAVRELKRRLKQVSEDAEAAGKELAEPLSETSVEITEHYLNLLAERLEATRGAGKS